MFSFSSLAFSLLSKPAFLFFAAFPLNTLCFFAIELLLVLCTMMGLWHPYTDINTHCIGTLPPFIQYELGDFLGFGQDANVFVEERIRVF